MITPLMLLGGIDFAPALTGLYLQTDLGIAVAPPLDVHGSDNDWGTKCDLIINPHGLETAGECGAAPPRTSWTNALDGGSGITAGFADGYDWGGFRLEGEYLHRVTSYDDRADTGIFDEVTLDKREQEIELAVGGVDDLQSHGVFTNAYYDFLAASSAWTPYAGAGVGVERASLAYFSPGSATMTRRGSRRSPIRNCAPNSPAPRPSGARVRQTSFSAIRCSPGWTTASATR